MTTQLREAIARLRSRTRLRNGAWRVVRDDDVKLICDALESYLKSAPKFDKVAYMREYMRKRRAKA